MVAGLQGILTVVALIYATLVGFMVHAKVRWRQPVSRRPLLPIIGLFLLAHTMGFAGSRTEARRWTANTIVTAW